MLTAAVVLAVLGLAATFLPQEILRFLGQPDRGVLPLLIQLLGALYLGFAMLDWMTKDSLIGGIYNRPVAVANLLHFASGALALVKGTTANADAAALWPLAVVYSLLGVAFAVVLFTSPVKPQGTPRAMDGTAKELVVE